MCYMGTVRVVTEMTIDQVGIPQLTIREDFRFKTKAISKDQNSPNKTKGTRIASLTKENYAAISAKALII